MKLRTAYWLVRTSVVLDARLLVRRDIPLRQRGSFVAIKYLLLLRHRRRPFQLGCDSVMLWGERIYYDSPFGIAAFQGILTRTQQLLDLAELDGAKTIIDVGANVGYFSLMAAKRFRGARILSIEPIPQTFRCLDRNATPYSNITSVPYAMADHSGTVEMSFAPSTSALGQVTADGGIHVEARTLDMLAESYGISSIDLLKIDTETFEAHVIRGAQEVLGFTRFLLIEVTVAGNENYTITSLFSLLSTDKFDFQLVGFRNFADRGEGEAPILDCLLENVVLTQGVRNRRRVRYALGSKGTLSVDELE